MLLMKVANGMIKKMAAAPMIGRPVTITSSTIDRLVQMILVAKTIAVRMPRMEFIGLRIVRRVEKKKKWVVLNRASRKILIKSVSMVRVVMILFGCKESCYLWQALVEFAWRRRRT